MSSGKQEGPKLFSSRILSRDSSNVANASFRVYYSLGAAGTVPFVWESKPGTPKSAATPASAANSMPPISPPPSYQSMSRPSSKIKRSWRRPASWHAGGWISWLSLNIRRRPPPSSPTDHHSNAGLHRTMASTTIGGSGVLPCASELVGNGLVN
uniref:Uncharacterized protein n=1 Tax=Arundo donax TaxID=35708 RepID=A0A0A9DIV0_ARUDO